MLIIGLNGSPHREGNVAYLLNAALGAAARGGGETEVIYIQDILADLPRPYCVACGSPCPGECYRGTLLERAFARLRRADALILGSPVHFGTVSAQLKAFWDMSRKLRTEKALLNTVGGAVTVGAARFGGQETTVKALYDLMFIQGMIVVGDGHVDADAGHHGVCGQRPAAEDEFAVARAEILGRRIAQVAEATRGLRPGT